MTTARYNSPVAPPSEYEAELLIITMEECAEVAQRASKALRFGLTEVQPGQPYDNAVRLAQEIGDLWAMVGLLIFEGMVDEHVVARAAEAKTAKLVQFMQFRPR